MVDPYVPWKTAYRMLKAIAVVYVDDNLGEAKGTIGMQRFKDSLATTLIFYMGCHIQRDRGEKVLKANQPVYLKTIVDRFNVSTTSKLLASTKSEEKVPLLNFPTIAEEKEEARNIPYREGVGALLWALTMTRPDIGDIDHSVAR